ncbi:hypothetical protein OG763_41285 [Streptomyces sp. NBC_01230]|nr:hypothetical protein OG763_41285 [Streptomyces sp. NBC_01230]
MTDRSLSSLIDLLAETVAQTSRPVSDDDRAELLVLLTLVEQQSADETLSPTQERRLAIAVHALAFVRRMRDGERLDDLGPEVFAEVPEERLRDVRQLLALYCTPRAQTPSETEVLLFALHFEAARQSTSALDLPA